MLKQLTPLSRESSLLLWRRPCWWRMLWQVSVPGLFYEPLGTWVSGLAGLELRLWAQETLNPKPLSDLGVVIFTSQRAQELCR